MYWINRGLQAIRLLLRKLQLRGNLELSSPLCKYDIARTTHIKCGNNGKMVLGDINVQTNVHLVSWGGMLIIGKGCSFNRNDIIVSRKQITIGNGTLIGPNVCIYDHDHAFGPNGIIKDKLNCGKIIIGNNVWIGAGTIILKNTTIGDNSVIGAGCVISGNIPDHSLVTAANRDLKIAQLHETYIDI